MVPTHRIVNLTKFIFGNQSNIIMCDANLFIFIGQLKYNIYNNLLVLALQKIYYYVRLLICNIKFIIIF